MDKLQKTKYENLIIEAIKKNERYRGNEDLLRFIYEDVVTRLGSILDTINDEAVIQSYVERIAKLSVITIIKKRTVLLATAAEEKVPAPKKDYSGYYDVFSCTPADNQSDINIKNHQAVELKSEIIELVKQYPQKEFIKLYNLRYKENRTLEAISDELNVSQAQAAERLFELAAPVKRIFGNEVS